MGAIQRVAGTLPLAFDPDYSPARGFLGPRWVTFGRSRVRESRTLGSVGAKAEWLSYPTTTRREAQDHSSHHQPPSNFAQPIRRRHKTIRRVDQLGAGFGLTFSRLRLLLTD